MIAFNGTESAKKRLKVAFFAAAGPVGAFRMRYPADALRRFGHDVHVLDPIADPEKRERLTREAGEGCDVVVMGPIANAFDEDAFRDIFGDAKLVWDLDDDLWAWESFKVDFKRVTGLDATNTAGDLDVHRTWMDAADAITTTTQHLAGVIRGYATARKRIEVTPNALPEGVMSVTPEPSLAAMVKKANLRRMICWTGSVAHVPDAVESCALKALGDMLPRITVPGMPSPSIGYLGRLNMAKLLPPHAKIVGTAELPFGLYYPFLKALNPYIGLIPMRPTAFNLSKSPLTLWTWAAMGAAPIVSDVGPYASERVEGFPAIYVHEDTANAWGDAIASVLYNPMTQKRMVAEAQRFVRERRSFPAAGRAWERVFLSLTGGD